MERRKVSRVLEVGGLPPPYGGITVHIERLTREATSAGFSVSVADPIPDARSDKSDAWNDVLVPLRGPSPLKLAQLLLACGHADLIHFHASALDNLWVVGLAAPLFKRPYIASIHGGNFPQRWTEISAFKRRVIADFLSRAHAVVCVSEPLRAFTEQIAPTAKTLVSPAFIPPVRPQTIHPAVEALRTRCEKLVLTSGFPLKNYGIESFTSALTELSNEFSLGAVVVLYPTSDPTHPDRYRREEDGVRSSLEKFAHAFRTVVVLEDMAPEVFASVQMGCDVFVRNTQTDGDSVALREAAYLGCQIVASSCTARPQGSVLFQPQDSVALASAIRTVLGDPMAGRIASSEDNAEVILALYRDALAAAS